MSFESLVRSSSERLSEAHREPLRRLVRGVAVAIGISLFMPSAHAPALELTAKEFAHYSLNFNTTQYKCLASLWGKESAWNPKAYNPAGAYGIPQLKNKRVIHLSANDQVTWGLRYIKHRHNTPCQAWRYWQRHGNY